MSKILSKEIIAQLNNAHYNIDIDDRFVMNPFERLRTDDPNEFYTRLTYLLMQPEYFSFICKHILNVEILPFQALILKEMWIRKFPMLIASRGASKSFMLSLYAMLRALLMPNRKVVIIGAAFRQSKFLFDYMTTIWRNAPILRDLCDGDSGPRSQVDMCKMTINGSTIVCLPTGDGQKIRGLRGNDIISDEFGSQSREIFENVIAGFAAVSANPVENVKNMAKNKMAKELNYDIESLDVKFGNQKSNQIILSGTAYYDFNHFADYWRRWKSILETKGDQHKISMNVFNGEPVPDSFKWDDYSIIRLPVDLVPRGFMDDGQIARSKATVHNGIYLMEFGACGKPDTEIVTTKGLKQIVDVEVGDLVLTHKGRFRKVLNKTFRDYNGDLCLFKSAGYYKEFGFTPDHPFWSSGDEFLELDSIGRSLSLSNLKELEGLYEIDTTEICSDYVDREDFIYPRSSQTKIDNQTRNHLLERMNNGETASALSREYGTSIGCMYSIKNEKRKPKNSIPKKIRLDYNFGLCVGYYASEGSSGADGRSCSFALDGHVDGKLDRFVKQLSNALYESIGIIPKVYTKNDTNISNVSINSRIFVDVMKYICPGICYNKMIRHEILFSNEDFLKGFIIGMWNGDGHKRDKFACLSLANKNLVYQVKLALSYFGINSSFLKLNKPKVSIIKGRVVKLSEVWKLNVSGDDFALFMDLFYDTKRIYNHAHKTGRTNIVSNNGDACLHKITSNKKEWYSGRVYNLEVEEDNSYSLPNATVHNCFAKDSQGFFKRSLIESCVGTDLKPVQLQSGPVYFDPLLRGIPNKKYVIAVDPASEVDNFSIVIIELHADHRRVVYCWTTTRKEHIEKVAKGITKDNNFYSYCSRKIRDLMDLFNVIHISMDSQGGGYAVSEALHDTASLKHGELPIWPIIDPDERKPSDNENGLHILELCSFSDYEWYSEANHGLRKDLETKAILFPRFDPITIGLSIEEDAANSRLYDTLEDCVMEIEELKNELSLIEITASVNGRERWDTPEVKVGVNKKKRMRKDRYSALIMANIAGRRIDILEKPKTYNSYGGFSSRSEKSEKGSATFSGPKWFTNQMNGLYD